MATLIRCDRCRNISCNQPEKSSYSKITIDNGVDKKIEYDLCDKCAKQIIEFVIRKPEIFSF